MLSFIVVDHWSITVNKSDGLQLSSKPDNGWHKNRWVKAGCDQDGNEKVPNYRSSLVLKKTPVGAVEMKTHRTAHKMKFDQLLRYVC